MARPIDQKRFFAVWKEVCKKNEARLLELWYKENNSIPYTQLILKGEHSITSQIAEVLNLRLKHEYYSVDAVYYRDEDLVITKPKHGSWSKTDGGLWLTKFTVLLEHENWPFGESGAYQEICHLLTVTSELKVLVTYQGKDKMLELVEDLNEVIPKDRRDQTPIMLIIGYEESYEILWSAYSLNGSSYSEI